MTVNKRSDSVFQLSLTEIAFTIAFILLLLLGYLVMRESEAKKRAQEELAKVQDLEAAQLALDEASKRLQEGLGGLGAPNPDQIISRLVADAKAAAERDRLQVLVQNLEAQISALSEVKQSAADAAKEGGKTEKVDRIVAALVLQEEAEKAIETAKDPAPAEAERPAPTPALAPSSASASATSGELLSNVNKPSAPKRPSSEETRSEVKRSIRVAATLDQALLDAGGKPLPAGQEAHAVAELVRAAQSLKGLERSGKGVDAVLKENADLRGQMANMRSRANAVGRGLDHPPCWADEAGNIEYLFNVELKQGVTVVTPAWPESRRQDAEKLPGVPELIAGPVNSDRFRTASRPILDLSKRQDPECRHFVVLNNNIESRREADQARWMVEEFFYKREARR